MYLLTASPLTLIAIAIVIVLYFISIVIRQKLAGMTGRDIALECLRIYYWAAAIAGAVVLVHWLL